MQLLFVTGNKNKVREVERVLGFSVEQIEIDLPEIQAINVQTVIEAKAKSAYHQVGRAILVEDTGLSIKAWNGMPGALITWFLKSVGNEGICRMLEGFEDRQATAETWIGFYDGKHVESFFGITNGTIAESPRGTKGFGWDSLFIPDGFNKTFAELTEDEKAHISMRTEAVLKLKAYLGKQNLLLHKTLLGKSTGF